jgi:ribonuclease P protein component
LREIVRLTAPELLRPGHDYVLIGRRAGLQVPFQRLAEDFQGVLRRLDAGRSK